MPAPGHSFAVLSGCRASVVPPAPFVSIFIRGIRVIRGKDSALVLSESSVDLLQIVYHSVPVKLGVFEVQKEGNFQACDVQVAQHLGDVRVVKFGHHLWVGDDFSVDDKVGNQLANELPTVVNGVLALLFNGVASQPEFYYHGVFIELFIETRVECVQYHDRRTDDVLCYFFVDHMEND